MRMSITNRFYVRVITQKIYSCVISQLTSKIIERNVFHFVDSFHCRFDVLAERAATQSMLKLRQFNWSKSAFGSRERDEHGSRTVDEILTTNDDGIEVP